MPSTSPRCPMVTSHGAIPCELELGHNSPHENTENGKLTWEPRYVGDLRQEAEAAEDWKQLLREVLDDVGAMSSEAIEDARRALEVTA